MQEPKAEIPGATSQGRAPRDSPAADACGHQPEKKP